MQIGIAGAGLVGRLMAWQLLRAGHQVTLFDRDTKAGELSAARVAAAMIAPFSEVVNCERDIFEWGLQALDLWPEWLAQLRGDIDADIYFQRRGSIVVAHRQDQAYLDHFNQLLRSRVPEYQQDYAFLGSAALTKLEPALADHFSAGTYLQQEGCLDNWGLLDGLTTAIEKLGGIWHTGTIIKSVAANVIHTEQQPHRFDLVIDSRGFGAKAELQNLRGVRGEVLWVHAPEVTLSRPVRLMHPRYQLYIAPKPNHVYVIGATEIESESLQPITVRSSLELQSALYSISSRFSEAHILKAYANCRPAFINNLPRIEPAPGMLRINGLYRHGYLLSPVVIGAALATLSGDFSHSLIHCANQFSLNASA